MNQNTHEKVDQFLCGKPVSISEGRSQAELLTTELMQVDDSGLVHGGFIFGLADYAAMIAVNHPNVVLGAANVKFLKPVKVGQKVIAEAQVTSTEGKKHMVEVNVHQEATAVFSGEFTCFVLDKHVLSE